MAIINVEKWNMTDVEKSINKYLALIYKKGESIKTDWDTIENIYRKTANFLPKIINSMGSYEPLIKADPILKAYKILLKYQGPSDVVLEPDIITIHQYKILSEGCYNYLKELGWKI